MSFYKNKKSLSKKQLRFYESKRISIFARTGNISNSVDDAMKLALLSPKS